MSKEMNSTQPRTQWQDLRPSNWSETTRFYAKAGAVATAIGAAAIGFGVGQSEQTPQQPETITYTVEPGQTVSEIITEACPTLSGAEVLEAQKEIGRINGSTNPSNPQVRAGRTIDLPIDIFCDSTGSE